MSIYNIIDILLLIVLISILVLFAKHKFLKFSFYIKFKNDDKLHTKVADSLPGNNTVYATDRKLSKYIKKYVFSRNGEDKLLISNYTKPFEEINYYVVCLNRKNKPLEVLEVSEKNTTTTSKIVGLPKETSHVNIVLKSVDGIALNSQIISLMSMRDIKTYALLRSVALFSFLYLLRDAILFILYPAYRVGFMNSFYIMISTGSFVIVAFISYILYKHGLKKRNIKLRSGGILEHEFF